jgi:hypothetical protein
MSKSKKPPVDQAVATVHGVTTTDVQKVQVTHQIFQAMQSSPDWSLSPTLQAAAKAWDADATTLDAGATAIASLRTQLRNATAKQASTRRDWRASKTLVEGIVTVVCAGAADRVKALSLDVVSHARLGALAAPTGLVAGTGLLNGEAIVSWVKRLAKHGFVVRLATDANAPATFSMPVVSTKRKLTLGGLPHGASLSFRVAAIDPASATGQSPWSAWVLGILR